MPKSSSATGDATNKGNPLQLSKSSLAKLLDSCRLPPHTLMAFGSDRFHLSHLVQHGPNEDDGPTALILLLRIPRNSRSISLAMRIRLADRATVVFVATLQAQTGQAILDKCLQRRRLLQAHPLYLLALVYEMRTAECKAWFDEIRHEINVVSSATGMTRSSWRVKLSPKVWEWFSDYDNLLRQLHASHTELSHFDTVTVFCVKLGRYLLDSVTLLESLEAEAGGLRPKLRKWDLERLRERIRFTLSGCDFDADKAKELLERIRSQLNVVSFTLPIAL